jgi:osmotically-inducible protein OsmY
MKTDAQLKSDVVAELAWDPAVNAAHVGVSVADGVVTLSGSLDSLAEKHAAEKAARRFAGVRGVAVDLSVKLAAQHQRDDTGIAEAVVRALDWNSDVPASRIKAQVEDGWVTLTGEVDWRYQMLAAERAVRTITGVRGITNKVTMAHVAHTGDIRAQIAGALARHAQREAARIAIDVDGGVVTLTGEVDSLGEHDAVVGTAFAAKGVSRVVDRLQVGH